MLATSWDVECQRSGGGNFQRVQLLVLSPPTFTRTTYWHSTRTAGFGGGCRGGGGEGEKCGMG